MKNLSALLIFISFGTQVKYEFLPFGDVDIKEDQPNDHIKRKNRLKER